MANEARLAQEDAQDNTSRVSIPLPLDRSRMDDCRLMEQMRDENDERAHREICDRHGSWLEGVLIRRRLCRDCVPETINRTLWLVWHRRKLWDTDKADAPSGWAVRSYLWTIAFRAYSDIWQRNHPNLRPPVAGRGWDSPPWAPAADVEASSRDLRKLIASLILRCLGSRQERERQILRWRYWADSHPAPPSSLAIPAPFPLSCELKGAIHELLSAPRAKVRIDDINFYLSERLHDPACTLQVVADAAGVSLSHVHTICTRFMKDLREQLR